MPTAQALERFAQYRRVAADAGRSHAEVDAVLERHIALDEAGDDCTLGGSPADLATTIGELRAASFISHLVWVRDGDIGNEDELFRFASEVHPALQA
jgi:hypothetical protein